MLAVARILRTGAKLLLLDEISEGLAPVIVQKLAEMVIALRQSGYTVLMVEQNFRFAAPLAGSDLTAYEAKLKTLPGVGSVAPPTVSSDKATAAYTVTMSYNPQSTAAVSVLKTKLRPGAHAAAPAGTYALVGGTTAVFADIQRAVNHDYAVVFPVAALIILVILGYGMVRGGTWSISLVLLRRANMSCFS